MENKWTEQDDLFLVKNYASLGPTKCAKQLGKPYDSVKNRGKKLKLQRPKNTFTQAEDLFIIDNAESGGRFIADRLNREIRSVQHRASTLNISLGTKVPWSAEEEVWLRENYLTLGPSYCSKFLARTVKSVERKGDKLDLRFYKKWTREDDAEVIDKYPFMCSIKLASSLKVSLVQLLNRAFYLGVQKANSLDKTTLGFLYIVKFPKLDLYKVGITNNPTNRFSSFGHFCEVLSLLQAPYKDVEALETYLLKYIDKYKINTKKLTSGNTETYRI